MPDQFKALIPDARAFYADLSTNNTRDWFSENKQRYDEKLKMPAKALLDVISTALTKLLDTPITTKLFRAHRDVRFSKDKTAYSQHLHMMWSPQGNGTQPVYFFGIAGEYVRAGAGIMDFSKAQQTDWRKWVSEREGDALQARIDTAAGAGVTLRKPELKRVPSPFEKDHPRADLLQRKSMTLWKDIEVDASKDLTSAITDAFKLFDPIMNDLRAFL